MPIDFEQEYGVNAGYVQALFDDWSRDPESVELSWRELFQAAGGAPSAAPATPAAAAAPKPAAAPQPATAPRPEPDDGDLFERLSGVAGRIVTNMEQSLELPTATSVRTLPAKLLDENRRLINEHMKLRALGKASYTHLIAFALVRALAEAPRVQSAFEERDGKPHRRVPANVNLGLAIDVPSPDGARMLVVPSIKAAETLDFRGFHDAYEEIVRKGRNGKLTAADYAGTTVTLTNPGGFGTQMSVPRLMEGQGLIVATGSIGIPAEAAGMSALSLADLALGPVMTVTSTYDHRVIQGAESGLLLKRMDELLQGADGFYADVFAALRIPWRPYSAESGLRDADRRDHARMQASVWQLINAYRVRGCRLADLDPLEYKPDPLPSLDPASYGFTVWDLERHFLCGNLSADEQEMTLRGILGVLRKAYCRRWTIEYMHIVDRGRKHWIREQVERLPDFEFETEHRMQVLSALSRAENFERFLGAAYVGNKRFSLEGADTLIPALAEILECAADRGVEKVVIGMAHRGRLNVLANILGKSYAQIFGEFEGVLLPLSTEGSGDVKYHLGQRGTYKTRAGLEVEVLLSANPSHLEAVDPVVCGIVRACQDAIGDSERRRVLGVLIHGDAAFSGQGVVPETLNMSELRAYRTGGTVHLVVNNQIGFTAGPQDLRSTYYCTDMAKSVEAPILHANGDFPESVLRAVRIAVDYRTEFGGDSVVDMVCYRRWGHNEGDEPAYTQPVLYAKIREHPTVRENYTRLLIRRGSITREEADEIGARFDAELSGALGQLREKPKPDLSIAEIIDLDDDEPADYTDEPSPETGIGADALVELIDQLNAIPPGHITHPNLLRQLRRREDMVRGERDLDWGCVEALAFASLVDEGVSIRLAGQDSGRGTFSHRHAVIRDQTTGAEHIPLSDLAKKSAEARGEAVRFEVWDSLLSEEAAVGFEYGYALERPASLVLWEAQFGDFVNGAQIPIDQFLVSGEAKWRQHCGLVLLLPHGYDGMGPEHSSAHPERFLASCSGGNVTVACCSSAAQYFHLLRRQGRSEVKRPLIVFNPKSLLRDPRAASPVEDLAAARFQELLVDPVQPDPSGVKRVLLCSGKVAHDLMAQRDADGRKDVAIVRLEQLYPLPRKSLFEALDTYPGADVCWVQEEPRNMGFWTYMMQRFRDLGRELGYAGRPESSSPATGSYSRHTAEQKHVLERAFDV